MVVKMEMEIGQEWGLGLLRISSPTFYNNSRSLSMWRGCIGSIFLKRNNHKNGTQRGQ